MAKKSVKRRAWTKQDVRELKSLARQKTPAPKIACAFKRTEGAQLGNFSELAGQSIISRLRIVWPALSVDILPGHVSQTPDR